MTIRKNLKVTGIANLLSFLLNFISVIVVSRLLEPSEIGIYSVSVAFLGFAHIFREFGVGEYLVQAKEVDDKNFRAAFSVTLISSWMIALILFALRLPLSALYEHDGVADVLGLLSINFMILPFGTPLLSLLRRNLEFNKLGYSMILSSIVSTSVTMGCAFAGQSYLSMAWGAIAGQISSVLILNFFCPGKTFILPTFKGLGQVVRFGSLTTIRSIIGVMGGSAPDIIFGKTLGFVDVAFFSRAVGLRKMLIERLLNFVRGVYFPNFASNVRGGGDAAQLYSVATNYLVSITIPVLVVMAILSEPLIVFLFGAQWSRSAPIATLICLYSILTAPYSLYGFSLIAAGKIKLSLLVEIVAQSAKILVLLTSIWLSLEQVVYLLLIAFLVEAMLAQHALKIAFDLRFSVLLRQIKTSLYLTLFAAPGAGIIVYLSHYFAFTEYRLIILMLGGTSALIGWILGVFVTNHVMKLEVVNMVGQLRNKLSL